MPSQATDLPRQRFGQGFEPALEGAPAGKAPSLLEEFAHALHLGSGFLEHRERFAHLMQRCLTIMTTDAFRNSLSG